jgi:hypothetical protein
MGGDRGGKPSWEEDEEEGVTGLAKLTGQTTK